MTESSSREWLLARPEISEVTAAEIGRRYIGDVASVREVGSQQDRNFAVRGTTGTGILLKFDHPILSDAERDFQRHVGAGLRAAGVLTPEEQSALDDPSASVITRDEGSGVRITTRAFTWIDGAPLADDVELSGAVAEQLGRLAGRSARRLAELAHPAAQREIQWELGHALDVVERLVGDLPESRRERCLVAARSADARLRELTPELPRQVIHGDLTSDNVLRDAHGRLWVVDLGDAATSWRISELAVTAADVLARSGGLAHVGRAVRGFAAESDLGDAELAALWPLVVLRGAVLAVSGWSQLAIDPENTYARDRLEHEWRVLESALEKPVDEATAHLRLAAGRPHRVDVAYAPLIEGRRAEVDFGIESSRLDSGAWLEAGIEERVVVEMREQGAPVVLAPFGEARLSRVPASSAVLGKPRARCVEVWADPGATITAPFSGELRLDADGEGDVDGDAIEVVDLGVVLRIDGVRALRPAGPVAAGEPLAKMVGALPIRITRRRDGVSVAPSFVPFDGEYEADGALDPSPIIGATARPDPEHTLLVERERRESAMGGASERYYAEPPQIERGWGALLIDTRGRALLDMVNNVSAIGHSHPALRDAVSRQLGRLNTNSRFLYRLYAEFTERLLEHAPDPSLDVVIPVSSGSEANDLAIRLAQVATGRRVIVAAREGYHGWTMASDAVSTSAFDNPNAIDSRPDWVEIVSAPNAYRGAHRDADAGVRYVSELQEHLAALQAGGRAPAAFISEPVLGNAGGVVPPAGYLAGAYDAIRAVGGLAIADEVQVGYGRLGETFWGSEFAGAVPDIMTVAKAAGNAFPLGAVITRRPILEALREEGMFFSSAGGAPASMAAGLAVLDVIRDEGLQENARVVGAHLVSRIRELADRHPFIGAVHGAGLYLGIELVSDRVTLEPARAETREVCERLLEHGIIMQATSERQNVLKVKPPMGLSTVQADDFISALDRVLSGLSETQM